MRRPLTSRERRGAALIILVLVLCLAYWLLIDSWFAGPLRDINEQTEQLREQQQRLPGEDPSAVAADLMQSIADLISSQANTGGGCELTQRMPITPEQDSAEPYRQVKVSLTLNCAIEPLTAILHALEYQRPLTR